MVLQLTLPLVTSSLCCAPHLVHLTTKATAAVPSECASLSLLYCCVRTAALLERAAAAHLLDELPFHPRPHQLCRPVVAQATRRLRLRNEDPRAVISDTVVSKREVRQYHWVQGIEDAIKKTASRGSVVLMSMHCQHALSLLLSLYCYC